MSQIGNIFYGSGNTLTSSGSYSLDPGAVLGILGNGGLTVESQDGSPVDATITLVGLLDLPVTAASTYSVTADANTVVAVTASSVGAATVTDLNADGGTIAISGGLLSALTGTTVNITNGGTFSGAGAISVASGLTINFGDGGGTLNLAGSSAGIALLSGASINGFGAGDKIIVSSNGATATVTDVSYSSLLGTSTLTFSNGDTLSLVGEYTDHEDGNGTYISTEAVTNGAGTELVVACFCRGTMIGTSEGERSVEDLQIGDLVLTVSGKAEPVRWIGRRSYSRRFAALNPDVMPVVFRQGSLGNGLPTRDLSVSPKHAMLLDGVLIPAEALLCGTAIARSWQNSDVVEYFHIELDGHQAVYAEGAPTESFVDDGSRHMFHNVDEYKALYPDRVMTSVRYCAPRLEDGRELEEIRRRLRAVNADQEKLSA
ncbi:Hint domain-containing protein [Gluconobacter morbifer]|uniref:Hedgehog/Intein (Hint) domain-containing protein n=1 Tax=Gluconobacter morbifer G707 TaxID=1088869 RepID=G6XG91_9PROT|nr:Hint domain-containing protein [Gluconobacter morbifer]EHH69199.1 hypothetical protein GMO_05060 [Gluconobacter morbifer G707]